jgi:hypothetical protein
MTDREHEDIDAEDWDDSEETPQDEALECEPRRRLWVRVLRGVAIGVGVTIVLLVVAAFLLYNFGGMSGSVHPELFAQYDQMVASGQAPAIQKRLVIPIPGCQCHSTDPVLTAQHSRRHMNECGKCHSTKPAHMEPGVL